MNDYAGKPLFGQVRGKPLKMGEIPRGNGSSFHFHAQKRTVPSFDEKIDLPLCPVPVVGNLSIPVRLRNRGQLLIYPCLDQLPVSILVKIDFLLVPVKNIGQ